MLSGQCGQLDCWRSSAGSERTFLRGWSCSRSFDRILAFLLEASSFGLNVISMQRAIMAQLGRLGDSNQGRWVLLIRASEDGREQLT